MQDFPDICPIDYSVQIDHATRSPSRACELAIFAVLRTEINAAGESVYSATRAGIEAFAETVRKVVADKDIKVSVIQPGSVDTPMQECSVAQKAQAVADHRMLHGAEVAGTILFVLTRSANADIVNLRIEPRIPKTS